MLKRIALIFTAFFFAFAILSISVLRCSDVTKFAFSASPTSTPEGTDQKVEIKIDYVLPYPGKILPDSPLWYLKALRDRVQFFVTSNPSRKSELSLLYADKRLGASRLLFEKDKPSLGLTTLTKGEKYLEKALLLEEENRKNGMDTKSFLTRLANASLKHWQEMEEIIDIAPEDAKPEVIKVQNYSKNVYNQARDALYSVGMPVPINPFDGE